MKHTIVITRAKLVKDNLVICEGYDDYSGRIVTAFARPERLPPDLMFLVKDNPKVWSGILEDFESDFRYFKGADGSFVAWVVVE